MIIAIIQARMGSSRMPKKVFTEIKGKPMLYHMLDRVRRATLLDDIVIATTTEPRDDIIAEQVQSYGIKTFRGSEEDVLDRYYQCARQFSPDIAAVVRMTADCPLIDPQYIDDVITAYLEASPEVDYVSNSLEPTLPDGMDCELFSFKTLERAWKEAKQVFEREHVAPYIYRNPDIFKLKSLTYSPDTSFMRWTVDYPEDFKFVSSVFEELYPDFGNEFSYQDVVNLLKKKPELLKINSGHVRNEKFLAQLKEFEKSQM